MDGATFGIVSSNIPSTNSKLCTPAFAANCRTSSTDTSQKSPALWTSRWPSAGGIPAKLSKPKTFVPGHNSFATTDMKMAEPPRNEPNSAI
jgi:hypothetical protein